MSAKLMKNRRENRHTHFRTPHFLVSRALPDEIFGFGIYFHGRPRPYCVIHLGPIDICLGSFPF